MKYMIAIVRPDQLDGVVRAIKSGLTGVGISRLKISDVICHYHQEGMTPMYRGYVQQDNLLHQVKLEMVVEDGEVQAAIDAITYATEIDQAEDDGIVILDLDQRMRAAKTEFRATG